MTSRADRSTMAALRDPDGHLATVPGAEAPHDMPQVADDRSLGQGQSLRDLGVAQALGDEGSDLALAGGQGRVGLAHAATSRSTWLLTQIHSSSAGLVMTTMVAMSPPAARPRRRPPARPAPARQPCRPMR